MKTPIPSPADAFIELVQFLQAHHETQQATVHMVWDLGPATGHLADAAGRIADQYVHADAFSAARVDDVKRALGHAGATGAPPLPVLPDPTSPEDGRVMLP